MVRLIHSESIVIASVDDDIIKMLLEDGDMYLVDATTTYGVACHEDLPKSVPGQCKCNHSQVHKKNQADFDRKMKYWDHSSTT